MNGEKPVFECVVELYAARMDAAQEEMPIILSLRADSSDKHDQSPILSLHQPVGVGMIGGSVDLGRCLGVAISLR